MWQIPEKRLAEPRLEAGKISLCRRDNRTGGPGKELAALRRTQIGGEVC